MTHRPWFLVPRDCLCCHPAHPETRCGTEWCRCVKYIEDTDEYPIGEVLCS